MESWVSSVLSLKLVQRWQDYIQMLNLVCLIMENSLKLTAMTSHGFILIQTLLIFISKIESINLITIKEQINLTNQKRKWIFFSSRLKKNYQAGGGVFSTH
ncbi:hypothetical protein AFL22_02020 [Pantoea sp. CFSAN033090]|nr:hypothetical protein AFL22_02020 [Pantoea sp. CFSAN033090]